MGALCNLTWPGDKSHLRCGNPGVYIEGGTPVLVWYSVILGGRFAVTGIPST